MENNINYSKKGNSVQASGMGKQQSGNKGEQKGDFFKKVLANIIMGAIVLTVLALSITPSVITVSASPSAIYSGSSDKNVSLMINVYWGNEYLQPMLNILNEKQVKTTFFVGGSWVMRNEELFKQIYNDGHEIGNHGFNHKDHKGMSEQRNIEEISHTHKLVKEVIGIDMNLFAPPSGSFDKTTLKVAESLGYKTVMWTKDTIDWRDKDKTIIFKRATEGIKAGSLILMHPTAATVLALEQIISTLLASGLNVTPVSQVL